MENVRVVNNPRRVTIMDDTSSDNNNNNNNNIRLVRSEQYSPKSQTVNNTHLAGLDLLSNPKKKSGNSSGSDNESEHGSDDELHDFSINRDNEDDDVPINQENISTEDVAESIISDESSETEIPKTYEEILQEKQELLYGLDRLEKQGYRISRKYTMASNIDDIRYEFNKVKRQRDVDKSIKFYRKALMAITSGVEYLNNRFDPLDVKLDGWSESQMENISDYDEIFEELHDKYSGSIEMAPELKLLLMVGGSAFMFHLTNTLFKSAAPSLDEVLKRNPDIMRNLSQATLNTMGENMGASPNNPILNMMSQGINVTSNARSNVPVGPRPDQSTGSRSMRGPQGVDNILSSLQKGNSSPTTGRNRNRGRNKDSSDAIEINF